VSECVCVYSFCFTASYIFTVHVCACECVLLCDTVCNNFISKSNCCRDIDRAMNTYTYNHHASYTVCHHDSVYRRV